MQEAKMANGMNLRRKIDLGPGKTSGVEAWEDDFLQALARISPRLREMARSAGVAISAPCSAGYEES
jgi:hypothetical protein